jgi:hypothetical protein
MDVLRYQDFMVLETQGRIAPRDTERLATSDKGVVLLREIMLREIRKVQEGRDPLGVIRDPARAVIDTHTETLWDERRARWISPSGVRIHEGRRPLVEAR